MNAVKYCFQTKKIETTLQVGNTPSTLVFEKKNFDMFFPYDNTSPEDITDELFYPIFPEDLSDFSSRAIDDVIFSASSPFHEPGQPFQQEFICNDSRESYELEATHNERESVQAISCENTMKRKKEQLNNNGKRRKGKDSNEEMVEYKDQLEEHKTVLIEKKALIGITRLPRGPHWPVHVLKALDNVTNNHPVSIYTGSCTRNQYGVEQRVVYTIYVRLTREQFELAAEHAFSLFVNRVCDNAKIALNITDLTYFEYEGVNFIKFNTRITESGYAKEYKLQVMLNNQIICESEKLILKCTRKGCILIPTLKRRR